MWQKSVKVNGFIRCMNVSPSLNPAKKWRLNTCKNGEEKEIERQEAYAEGERVGEKRGRTEGETRINKLTKYLLEQERTEDLKKAVSDAAYQAKLLKELGL